MGRPRDIQISISTTLFFKKKKKKKFSKAVALVSFPLSPGLGLLAAHSDMWDQSPAALCD